MEPALPETAEPDDASEDPGDVSDQQQSPTDSANGAAPVEQHDQDGEPSRAPGEAEIERLLERAEQTQGALRTAEVRIEGAEERARLLTQAESAIRRAAAAEGTAREAAATADRLAAKLVVLSGRLAAQEKELERQREEAAAAGKEEPEDDLQIPLNEWKPTALEEPEPEPQPETAPPPQPEPAPVAKPSLDINQATFEELCKLGLSVNQAARLIGQRDQQGGFSSLDDLDGLSGLPPDTIEMLKDAASD